MSSLKFVLLSCITGLTFGENVYQPAECPGLYCGRQELGPGKYTSCGACPRGYQPLYNSICNECTSSPTFYDWLYLGFMAIMSVLLHLYFIDYTNVRKQSTTVLHISAIFESVLAAVITLLLSDPMGTLTLRSCPVNRLEDWYSMVKNPSPNYTTTYHCTQEIVYPLYTIVMVYYAFSLLFMMCLRPFVSVKFVNCLGTKSIYAALYFLPILIMVQAVLGGLLYYSFPYIMIIGSLITSAIHLATGLQQGFKDLLLDNVRNIRNLAILVGHWLLHSYGIISLTELKEPEFHGPLLLLVFFPVLFYVFTSEFTNPENLDKVE
ncbi:hypothetical protein ACF0H5_003749 [Mactra antiquata]